MRVLLLLSCVSLLVLASPFSGMHEQLHRMEKEYIAAGVNLPATQWFTQELDHFNAQETRTWKQQYFLNDAYYNGTTGGPLFLMMGGEGAINSLYVTVLQMSNFAKQQGALQVALEHRFYGMSQPFTDLSTPNLAYLSIEQALADAAHFVAWVRQQYGPKLGKVIVFGGSYSGALSSWMRLKYPQLIHASVASSAPVEVVLDMFQYLAVVDKSLDTITGPTCDARIKQATTQIASMLTTSAGQSQLQSLFKVCKPFNGILDVQTFLITLMSNWMTIVQYNGEVRGPNITTLCDTMINPNLTPLNAYVAVANAFLQSGQCLDASWNDQIVQLKNITDFGYNTVGVRQWTYQTCTQTGYFQTTDSSRQPFGTGVPLSYYTGMCNEGFGWNFLPRINETNTDFGGNHPDVTRVVYVNGRVDPWHALSVLKNTKEYRAIVIPGTAHCADMMPTSTSDPHALTVAREAIAGIIHDWLH